MIILTLCSYFRKISFSKTEAIKKGGIIQNPIIKNDSQSLWKHNQSVFKLLLMKWFIFVFINEMLCLMNQIITSLMSSYFRQSEIRRWNDTTQSGELNYENESRLLKIPTLLMSSYFRIFVCLRISVLPVSWVLYT